jgi:hypothetical protein
MSDRYNAALNRLASESRTIAPPPDLESVLVRQFDRKRRSRRLRPLIAFAAAAAAVAGIWFVRPQPTAVLQTSLAPPAAPWSSLAAAPAPTHQIARTTAPADRPAEPEPPFIPIPYVAPLDPYERVDVVRMELPVSALIAAGLQVDTDDAGALVQADVVMSQDGRARAVRLVSISNFN